MVSLLINIDVPDLTVASKFYQEALGLKLGRQFDGVIELTCSTAPIYLLEKKSGTHPFPGSSTPRDYQPHWSPVHLDFVVEDIEVARELVLKAGAREESPIKTNVWGKIAMFRDPFGHGLCLIQFLGRGYDEISRK